MIRCCWWSCQDQGYLLRKLPVLLKGKTGRSSLVRGHAYQRERRKSFSRSKCSLDWQLYMLRNFLSLPGHLFIHGKKYRVRADAKEFEVKSLSQWARCGGKDKQHWYLSIYRLTIQSRHFSLSSVSKLRSWVTAASFVPFLQRVTLPYWLYHVQIVFGEEPLYQKPILY